MDFVEFQSTECGIYVNVPEDSEVTCDDGEDLVIENDSYTLSVHYFDPTETDEDEISQMLQEMMDEAEVDLEEGEEGEIENETLTGSLLTAADDETVVMGGVLYPSDEDEDQIGFIYTVIAPVDDAEMVGTIVDSLEFNAEALGDEDDEEEDA